MPEQEGTEDAQKYQKFKKVDGAAYEKVNTFLRRRTYVTAREWAIARLCADFKTTGGSEMTFIGEHLPELVPFMTDTYTPQAVNQARSAFKRKVKKAGATFFYGAMCGFFTAEELDDILFEASEVAKFLLEVEGTNLEIDEEISIEDRITDVMRNVAESAAKLRRSRDEDEEREAASGPVEGAGGDRPGKKVRNRRRVTGGDGGPGGQPPAEIQSQGTPAGVPEPEKPEAVPEDGGPSEVPGRGDARVVQDQEPPVEIPGEGSGQGDSGAAREQRMPAAGPDLGPGE
ncbi:MAG TPA: DUF5806 family protein [Methanomicrobiales archaeon]|nr:DUF5806 family protein [Methanomicrobiales archaeon]